MRFFKIEPSREGSAVLYGIREDCFENHVDLVPLRKFADVLDGFHDDFVHSRGRFVLRSLGFELEDDSISPELAGFFGIDDDVERVYHTSECTGIKGKIKPVDFDQFVNCYYCYTIVTLLLLYC